MSVCPSVSTKQTLQCCRVSSDNNLQGRPRRPLLTHRCSHSTSCYCSHLTHRRRHSDRLCLPTVDVAVDGRNRRRHQKPRCKQNNTIFLLKHPSFFYCVKTRTLYRLFFQHHLGGWPGWERGNPPRR